jgi:molecular chaperone GrpE (heat shock protein)
MSDVEARQSLKEVDKRQLEQQDVVSRFEMTYPAANGVSNKTSQLMEVRLAEQESHIAYLEDENLTLKERLFLVQQEVNELRQRLQGGSCDGVVDEHEDACSDYGSSD